MIELNDFGNTQVRKLPSHLRQYVVDQDYTNYTPQNHAVWRYVMRQNYNYLKSVSHKSYTKGLSATGIGIEHIPNLQDMNNILGKIGWGAVCVDGFIPPAAFMEFQAYQVLVIAADIRQINHIEYTPAPDIIHEAAGHAPIIADPLYSEYLRLFGEIGSKAISSFADFELYEAIRYLSIVKEDPNSTKEIIKKAEDAIIEVESRMVEPSEMAKIRNLHWWTVEYGLIGTLDNPKIYGAGLLSSIGESVVCMTDKVKKIPYSIAAADVPFDITEMQPQLYVTPDFRELIKVLNEFADTMALRKGGLDGIKKVIESANVATAKYSSGLQVSGVFTKVYSKNEDPIYISTTGPTALSYFSTEITGHDKGYHREGFGSPVGKLAGSSKPIEEMTEGDLESFGIISGTTVSLTFESGVKVDGFVASVRKDSYGKTLIISFSDCTVEYEGKKLFEPEWGMYDMAVGEKIDSVFSGPADITAYDVPKYVPKVTTQKIKYDQKQIQLHKLYHDVRVLRGQTMSFDGLTLIWKKLKKDFPNDWLLPLEILELTHKHPGHQEMALEIKAFLKNKAEKEEKLSKLIKDGISLIEAA